MRVYRSMKEAQDGLPAVGPSGRLLGVRPGNAATADVLAVNPSDIVPPGTGGMSVAPGDPLFLQRHRRPIALGGIGRDPVWYIETDDLGDELVFRQDRPEHGLVEPKCPLTLDEFQQALAKSRSHWQLYCR